MTAVPRFCSSCGSAHIGQVPCGLTWLQRMRSTQLHPDATPNREKRAYYDSESVAQIFGTDSEERMLDETQGRGPVYRHPRTGGFYRKDRRTKEPVRVTKEDVDFFTGAGAEG